MLFVYYIGERNNKKGYEPLLQLGKVEQLSRITEQDTKSMKNDAVEIEYDELSEKSSMDNILQWIKFIISFLLYVSGTLMIILYLLCLLVLMITHRFHPHW